MNKNKFFWGKRVSNFSRSGEKKERMGQVQ